MKFFRLADRRTRRNETPVEFSSLIELTVPHEQYEPSGSVRTSRLTVEPKVH